MVKTVTARILFVFLVVAFIAVLPQSTPAAEISRERARELLVARRYAVVLWVHVDQAEGRRTVNVNGLGISPQDPFLAKTGLFYLVEFPVAGVQPVFTAAGKKAAAKWTFDSVSMEYAVPLGVQRVGTVTGITESAPSHATVEFTCRIVPNAIGSLMPTDGSLAVTLEFRTSNYRAGGFDNIFGPGDAFVTRWSKCTANMTLYDDGWRIDNAG